MSDPQEHHYDPNHRDGEVQAACTCGWTDRWIRQSRRTGDPDAGTRAYLRWVGHARQAARRSGG